MRALCGIVLLACSHGSAVTARATAAKPHIVFTLTGAAAYLVADESLSLLATAMPFTRTQAGLVHDLVALMLTGVFVWTM
jgi:hypothetical protein